MNKVKSINFFKTLCYIKYGKIDLHEYISEFLINDCNYKVITKTDDLFSGNDGKFIGRSILYNYEEGICLEKYIQSNNVCYWFMKTNGINNRSHFNTVMIQWILRKYLKNDKHN